jgi:microcystin-dependent protein
MSEPFVGEVRLMAFDFAPKGWAKCDGQLLSINQNQAIFALMGTNYGGNGQTTFGLPNLRGRVPIHMGPSNQLSTVGGEEAHTLSVSEMPAHVHPLTASSDGADQVLPNGTLLGAFNNGYRGASNLVAIQPATIGNAGGSQAHENRQPFLVLNYCVALSGFFPTRN